MLELDQEKKHEGNQVFLLFTVQYSYYWVFVFIKRAIKEIFLLFSILGILIYQEGKQRSILIKRRLRPIKEVFLLVCATKQLCWRCRLIRLEAYVEKKLYLYVCVFFVLNPNQATVLMMETDNFPEFAIERKLFYDWSSTLIFVIVWP